MSHRYHPYARLKPLLPLPRREAEHPLSVAHRQLQKINVDDGELCTWDHGVMNTWKEVPRPQRVTSRGPVDIAASGFAKFPPKSPFFCPHTKSTGRSYKPLVLRLRGTHEGGIADFYHAVDHECSFKIIVPPLKTSRVLLTWEDREEYAREQRDYDSDESGDEEFAQNLSQTSMSSAASHSSSISNLAVNAIVDPSPRYGPLHRSSERTRPTPIGPIGAGSSLVDTPRLKSFYRRSVADARKIADTNIMEYLHEIDASGVLEDDATSHPAWDMDNPHPVLHVYDKRIYPLCLSRTNNYLEFIGKPLGQAVRQLNSATGIPYGDYTSLIRSTTSCESCKNHFSHYGYDAHVKDGRCTNHPDLQEVDESDFTEPTFRFRSFRNNKSPKKVGETLDSPVGAALLEWNSRLGIPTDVWMVISTAVYHCGTCDLVRSFPAHRLHLDKKGDCTDPGQEPIARAAEDDDQ
ncbi:hypothetical protein B0H19DRAFT_1247793 [Mycena capillaripes]|nr:hypothetical protein B0H19DRAFT_1247793 [Mycena capillaripes]